MGSDLTAAINMANKPKKTPTHNASVDWRLGWLLRYMAAVADLPIRVPELVPLAQLHPNDYAARWGSLQTKLCSRESPSVWGPHP